MNEEFKYNFFKYIPVDYSQYKDINDLPKRMDECNDAPFENLPDFIRSLLLATCTNSKGKEDFFRKFAIYYLSDSQFRKLTDHYSFLFIDGNYKGAFPTFGECVQNGEKIKNKILRNVTIFIASVHIPMKGIEQKETTNSVITSRMVEKIVENQIVFSRESKNYYINISIGFDSFKTNNQEYMIDTGASTTHVINEEYVNSISYQYSEYPYGEDDSLIVNPLFQRRDLLELNN